VKAKFQFKSVRSKMIAVGAVFSVVLIAFTLLASNAFSSMTRTSRSAQTGAGAQNAVDMGSEAWAAEDGAANMYTSLLALHDPGQSKAIDDAWSNVEENRQEVVNDLASAEKLAATPKEKALVATIQAGVPGYESFIAQVHAAGQAGQAARAIHIQTVDNVDVSTKLDDAFTAAREYESQRATEFAKQVNHQGASGKSLLIVLGLVGIAAAGAALTLIARGIVTPLRKSADALKSLAEKDLTTELDVSTADETRVMADSLNEATTTLRAALTEIARSSETVAASSEELMSVSTQVGASAEETSAQSGVVSAAGEQVSASVASVATAIEEMIASVGEIAQNAGEAANIANQAVAAAETSSANVSRLGEASSEIGDVIKTITSIAEQTNLLALNATIEAARAGDAGKGFAVVANEVKDLATETAQATQSISAKVEAIQSDTREAIASISRIDEIIHQIASIQTTIASAVEEQAATTNEIGRSIAEAAQGTGEIAENISGVAAAASTTAEAVTSAQAASSELAGLASELRQLVGEFRY
jgi:methyl-accepting chemotaxis protein